MATKRNPLIEGKVYHVFTKSIAGFKIFRNDSEYKRMRGLLEYYKVDSPPTHFRSRLFWVIG